MEKMTFVLGRSSTTCTRIDPDALPTPPATETEQEFVVRWLSASAAAIDSANHSKAEKYQALANAISTLSL